ncbi:hypothetical protein BZM27_37470 [Paraburkholderia steynii]|uniref:Uncharacterized protein n=1 Tax=Paraburkholderia steynii TaxID=1245441 RepID=A0A4V2NGH3_9BURK|nr:hypothetical protein BZM27_37470 [Paraburkholderia steynii]
MSASKQISVRVDDEDIAVWVAKTGKVTWQAWATFRGQHLRVSGSSEPNAIDVWMQTADYAAKA